MEKSYSEEIQVNENESARTKWAKWKAAPLELPPLKRTKWAEKIEDLEYFQPRGWLAPVTEAHKKSEELKELYEKDRISYGKDGTRIVRSDREEFDLFRTSHFDNRWFRSVYWDGRTEKYESRTYPDPVNWTFPKDWKPETVEEFQERSKDWLVGGSRLEHEFVILGGTYRLFEDPDHTEVRVVTVNQNPRKLPPKVYIKLVDGPARQWGRWVFSDELDSTVLNTKRSRKNWLKRQKATNRKKGIYEYNNLIRDGGIHD